MDKGELHFYICNLNLKKCVLGFFVPFILLTCAKIVSIILGDVYIFPSSITNRKILIILWALVAEELGSVFESYGYFAITKLAKSNIVPASIWHFTGNMMFNLYRFDPQWYDGKITFYWIATIFYAANILLFFMYEKKDGGSIYDAQR